MEEEAEKMYNPRDALLDGGEEDSAGYNYWGGGNETRETKNVDEMGLLDMQKTKMQEQDRILDMLDESVMKQKEIAIDIGDEIDDHILMLDALESQVESTTARVEKATARVKKITKKSSTPILWCIIVILLIAFFITIVLAILIP